MKTRINREIKRILVTGIGGPTPRSIAKTIRKDFPDYTIIGIDANPKALGFFMPGLVDKYFVAPRVTAENYWSFIEALVDRENIDMAFVQPEAEVIGWGNYYKKNGTFPCPVLIPQAELAPVLMDKAQMSDILRDTKFIPETLRISQSGENLDKIEGDIGFPCWIRAITGSGGLGSLKVENRENLTSWLFIHRDIEYFTVSEFLPGRHLATQMLYYDGAYIKGASLECVEYVMASIAPSRVTGNTSFGRLINEKRILAFCDECIQYIAGKLDIKPNGVLSFDLKEDPQGDLKVTEINIRHMAYTGVMADAGFDLVRDTILLLQDGGTGSIESAPFFTYDKPYVFLRDVDSEPLLLEREGFFKEP